MSLYTFTELEFITWLKSNRDHLASYTSDEVVHLALACGFDSGMIYRVLSHFQDAMNGTSIDRRADFQTTITEMTIKDVAKMKDNLEKQKPFDLKPYWKDLMDHNVTGEDVA